MWIFYGSALSELAKGRSSQLLPEGARRRHIAAAVQVRWDGKINDNIRFNRTIGRCGKNRETIKRTAARIDTRHNGTVPSLSNASCDNASHFAIAAGQQDSFHFNLF